MDTGNMTKISSKINFSAKLRRPVIAENALDWTFFRLPQDASDKLPSRSMVSVEGTLNGFPFVATLLPDGEGGHWLKVNEEQRGAAGAKVGALVTLEIAPVSVEPEPEVPEDLQDALATASLKAQKTWSITTAIARRDWIFWITSGKKAETRTKRIGVAIDKLSKGSRRPCCFDRSGMYDKSLSCPVALDE
jgi:hypothetical protein